MKEIKLEQFSGPLDLLLALIEQEKLNINDIALSKVTEQFFDYLNKLGDNRSEELADFLVIATKLVYIKSRNLLPYLTPEEEEGPSLAEQLKMYKRYREASRIISERWQAGDLAYGRLEPPVKQEGFMLPANAGAEELKNSIYNLLKRLKPVSALPKVSIDRAVTVKQKLESILNLLKTRGRISFRQMLAESESRTEVIVSFLALLELVKSGDASIQQKNAFADLDIVKT